MDYKNGTPTSVTPTSWWTETVSSGIDQVAGYAHTAVDEIEEILSIPKDTGVALIGASAGGASNVIGSAGSAAEQTWSGVGQASWGLAALVAAVLAALVLL